ncbi:MAG TPA: methyltransferase domain-containing protein [Bryobacteraceae bacterium]|nr:methyltransferase domain-containing protein [Bryobacteraceae bacterium]
MKRVLLYLVFGGMAAAQVAGNANAGYKTQEGRDAVARGLMAPDRDQTQHPREIVEAMEIRPGMTAADIGTGVGYMLPYLSQAVGKDGSVIGEDIAPDFIEKAKVRARTMNLTNIRFILGTDHDPKLPGDSVDRALVLDTYHHFDYPEAMLKSIRDSLMTDGRLYIVDYYKNEEAMPGGRALQHIRLDRDDVIREVQSNGFRLLSKHDQVPGKQYMLVFERTRNPE